MKRTTTAIAVAAAASMLALSACSSGASDDATGDAVTLNYWLWDDTQLAAYQTCADAFHEANPNITVDITQTSWSQYWTNLSTQITAGTAPDVFTNQISYFMQFVDNNQLLDLSSLVDDGDVDLTAYKDGLAERWVSDDARYGLPKDWDVEGLLYNVDVATAAGYTADDIAALTWNPDDGGTFGDFIKAMSLDSSGRNGLDPDYDASAVVRYGFYPEWGDGANGQNGWGNLAVSNGFTFSDDEGVATTFNYDSEPLVETMTWYQQMIDGGYMPQYDEQSSLGTETVMTSVTAASTFAGSFVAPTYLSSDQTVSFAYATVPEGPEGRTAATNGLADSVWAGTEHQDEALQWVAYLGSAECQDSVGATGVVYPAVTSGTEASLAARAAEGVDDSAFTSVADAGETFLLPIFSDASQVNTAIQDAMTAIAQGADPQETLSTANETVEALFQ
ncbi:MAG TPA: sugar ABC transporter substrate-binding protein [Cellulomonas sp.]